MVQSMVGETQTARGAEARSIAWPIVCSLNFFPIAAFLHNAVFFYPSCMLVQFGPDYDFQTIGRWLAQDPSAPWALAISLALYGLGLSQPLVRKAAAPIWLAFLPLSIWIWDIPFTGRIIRRSFHDGRLIVGETRIMSRFFYMFGAAAYLALLSAEAVRSMRRTSIR